MTAREIEVAVLGNHDPKASIPGEIVPHREFYDYAAKYLEEGTQLLIPAESETCASKKGTEAGGRRISDVGTCRAWRESISSSKKKAANCT